jgi:hypothetical protein
VLLGCCSVLMHAPVRTRCFPGVLSSVCLVPGLAFLWCNDMVCILASFVLCPCPCGYSPWSCRCNSSSFLTIINDGKVKSKVKRSQISLL